MIAFCALRENSLECLTCKSISGERRISPGPTIYEGRHWLVEHAYPCGMKGWLVLVLKRHVEALHDLTPEEFAEPGELQGRSATALHRVLGCEKEYAACFAEAQGFNHIHFHIVARPHDLPDELKGSRIFAMLKVTEQDAVPPNEIVQLCIDLQKEYSKN